MTAASFWSLLDPAFRIAHEENFISTEVNFFLIFNGFLLGAAFVYMTDLLLPSFESKDVFKLISKKKFDDNDEKVRQEKNKWNRLLLLIIAVTVHNFPGASSKENDRTIEMFFFLFRRSRCWCWFWIDSNIK